MKRFALIPWWAYPALLRHRLRRFIAARRPPPAPDLADADLDFCLGGTVAVERRLEDGTFKFFSAADFERGSELLPQCEDILAHRFDLLGSGPTPVGDPIPWRRDFKTGYEWPRMHVSRLQLVTTEGDVKVPWELSRFQHGVTLALAYTLTGDESYPRGWAAQFHAWRADNPPEFGPNWGNAMEAAIRAVNWIAAFEWMRPAFDRATGESFLKALIQHGRFIASHLEDYWPPTNHLLADLCGLIWISLYLTTDARHIRRSDTRRVGALREPHDWLALGLRELARQVRFQILPDGASYEASSAYHRFVTEMVASTVRLCELNNVFVPGQLRQTASKMERAVQGLLKPDGTLPLFGDEDGGKWLPHLPRPTGEEGKDLQGSGWTPFPHAGWFIHRDGDEYLAIRAGANGQAGCGGHAHNDALSFEYAVGRRTFFLDPGTYAYTADPESRNLFRATAYHNTLRVDGEEISRIPPGELFRLEDDVRVKFRIRESVWEGEHEGYGRLGIIHRRRLERRGPDWVIRDTVKGAGVHHLEWFFHLAAHCPLRVDSGRVHTEYAGGPNLALRAGPEAMACELQPGWVSPSYGRREPAPIVRYSLRTQLPFEVEFTIARL